MMPRILAFLVALTLAGPAAAGPSGLSQSEVRSICTAHYAQLVADVVGALNMGMSPEAVKARLSKGGNQQQLIILNRLIDAILARDGKAADNEFALLIDQCVQDNFNPKQRI